MSYLALKLINRLLKDLSEEEDKNKQLEGKTTLMCGDFRLEFSNFHHLTFTQNMRALLMKFILFSFLKRLVTYVSKGRGPYFSKISNFEHKLKG